jgi:hypothetical protein
VCECAGENANDVRSGQGKATADDTLSWSRSQLARTTSDKCSRALADVISTQGYIRPLTLLLPKAAIRLNGGRRT